VNPVRIRHISHKRAF